MFFSSFVPNSASRRLYSPDFFIFFFTKPWHRVQNPPPIFSFLRDDVLLSFFNFSPDCKKKKEKDPALHALYRLVNKKWRIPRRDTNLASRLLNQILNPIGFFFLYWPYWWKKFSF